MLRTTVSRLACFGVKPYMGQKTRFLLLSDSDKFADVGAISDERTGLSFTVAVGNRQCSYSRVRIPRDR
jgi:hypothetical protein